MEYTVHIPVHTLYMSPTGYEFPLHCVTVAGGMGENLAWFNVTLHHIQY